MSGTVADTNNTATTPNSVTISAGVTDTTATIIQLSPQQQKQRELLMRAIRLQQAMNKGCKK